MPNGDRTGPNGMGSMTGRRAGFCSGNTAPGWTAGRGGAGFGMGRGQGLGRGRGIGMGRGQGFAWTAPQPMQPTKEMLQNEVNALEAQLKATRSQLNTMEENTPSS